MSLKIETEFRNLIPPLTAEEYQQLEKNIIQEGVRDKIVVWQDTILDGHNRYEIALKHGIGFEIEEKDFDGRDQVKEWIILNQFGRRNLTAYDRSQLALKLKPIIAEKARENQIRTLENRVSQKSVEQKVDTQKELAKIAGVSHDTIHKVEVIEEKAPDDIKQQLKSGELSINQAYILTKSAEEAQRQNEEHQKQYEAQLQKEKQDQEEKKKLEEYEASLPENTVVLDKFRKLGEVHIFGITDFNDLTDKQFDECLKHCKKYQDAISKVEMLYTDTDSLKAWECVLETQEEVDLELKSIGQAIQQLLKIQNYFKGVKK